MLKFILQFSCWKLNSTQTLVICSCAKTKEVAACVLTEHGNIFQIESDRSLPDVRKQVPCRWNALTAVQRANVRGWWLGFLEDRYGKEEPPVSWGRKRGEI